MQNRLWLLFFAILVIFCIFRIVTSQKDELPKGKDLSFEATIIRDPISAENGQIIYIKDLRIYTNLYPKYKVGDRIKVSGFAEEHGSIFNASVQKISSRHVAFSWIGEIRQKILTNIQVILPEKEATLVSGSVLGVDTISADFKGELTKTGTIHVVVVSGQNLMIVVGAVMSLVSYFGRKRCLAISLICVFLYSILAGFEPPVIRACLMVLTSSLAIYFGREVNALWSLVLAALVILIFWPQAIFEISFLLTFSASLGIITLGRNLSKLFSRVPIVGEGTAVAISAFLFTAPVIVYFFGTVSILSPIVNVLVVEAVSPIMFIGFLIAIFSLVFMPISQVLAFLVFPFAFYFVQTVSFFARLNVGQISAGQGNWLFVIFAYAILLLLMIVWKGSKKQEIKSEV